MTPDRSPQRPRLLQVVEFDRPHGGSFVPLIRAVLEAARGDGWETMAVLPEAAGDTEWIGGLREVADIRLAPERLQGSRLRRLRWLGAQFGPSSAPMIAHTHFTSWDVATLLAARSGRWGPASTFWHIHSALPRDPLVVARSAVKFGLLGRGTAGIICPAPNIALGVMQRLGPRGRVHFVPSALDPELYPLAGVAERKAARAALEIPDGARVLLHFGWHPYLKGTDIFLRVVAELLATDDRIVALIRGHEQESVELADRLGIADRVRFQPPVPDAATLFAAADLVVSSSREEGMAYTVLEALSTGTPVVASAIPGHAYIGEQVEACRITSIEPGALRSAIAATLELSAAERVRQAERAHRWIVENLSTAAISRQLLGLYADALPGGERSTAAPAAMRRPRARSRRIVQVADYANPGGGSFIPMLAAISGAVAERGWRAEVVLPERAAGCEWLGSLEDSGAKLRFAPAVGRDGTRRWLRELAESEDGSMIAHTHFTGFDVAAALAAAGTKRLRVVWHVHSALSASPAIVGRNIVKFGLLGRAVEAIICPAPDLVGALVERGAPAGRIEFVPNAVDLERFVPAGPADREAARRRLGVPLDGPMVLGFGWDWEIKSSELFLRAAQAASQSVPGLHVVLVSEDQRGPMLRAELELDRRVTLLRPVTDVRDLYAAADAFVAVSAAEGGTPLAVLEALASGVPVVASDIPPHRFIAVRSTGVSLATRQTGAIAAAITAALGADPNDRPTLQDIFGLDRFSAELMAIYERFS